MSDLEGGREMECPNCKLQNPEGSPLCACGYAFPRTGGETRQCPYCAEAIQVAAVRCRRCGESLTAEPAVKNSSAVGIAAVVLGIAGTLLPYFAAVFLVPATLVCGFIAYKRGQRRMGAAGVVLGIVGALGIAYASRKIAETTRDPFTASLPQLLLAPPAVVPGAKHDGIQASNEAHPKAEAARDFSTPATRLVGRWKDASLTFGSIECEFFGPVDAATKMGAFTRYRLTGPDKKAKQPIWKEFDFQYRVIGEDSAGDRVTINLLFADGDSRPESHYIEHNGLLRIAKTVVAGMESSSKLVYVDGKNLACSEK